MTTCRTSNWERFRRRPRKWSPAKPVEQQRLILEELARQIDNVNTRQAAVIDRAAIVVAADVVLSALIVAQLATGWLLIPILISVVSAVFALRTIGLWKSKGSKLSKALISRLLRADPYSVGHGIVRDRLKELNAAVVDLERKQKRVRLATATLIAAWGAAVVVGTLHYLQLV